MSHHVHTLSSAQSLSDSNFQEAAVTVLHHKEQRYKK
jgi:hypothetical protein